MFANARDLPEPYWRVLCILAVFSLVNFPDALLLRLHEIGFTVAALFLAYIGYNLGYGAISYPAGRLADRMPKPRVFAVGLVFFAVGYLGLGLPHNHLLAWITLCLYGLFSAFTDSVAKALVSAWRRVRTSPARRASFRAPAVSTRPSPASA